MEVIAPLDDEPPIHHHLGDPATSTPSVHATDEVISDLDEELLEEEICADLGIEERSSSFLWGPGAHVSDDSSRSAPSWRTDGVHAKGGARETSQSRETVCGSARTVGPYAQAFL